MQLSRLLSFGLIMGFALTLAACGGKDEKKDSGAKDDAKKDSENNGDPSSAAKKASEKVIGKWELDSDATVAKLEANAKTEEQKNDLLSAKGFLSGVKMKLEITADGKVSINMIFGDMAETKEGTYEVKSEDVSSVVIAGTVDGKTKDIVIKFVDDDTIEFEGIGGPTVVVMKRAN